MRVHYCLTFSLLVIVKSLIAQTFEPVQINPFFLVSDLFRNSACDFGDLNGDTYLDMIVGKTNMDDLVYSENSGTSQSPDYSVASTGPYTIPNGWYTNTVQRFVDIDNDGDLDILGGSLGFGAGFLFSENTGGSTAPSFAGMVNNPFNLPPNIFGCAPAFADLDNDGDLDVMSGSLANGFFYLQNEAPTPNDTPDFPVAANAPFGISNPGTLCNGEFWDYNNDGLYDFIAVFLDGSNTNVIQLYENNGSPSIPSFAAPTVNPFGLSIDPAINFPMIDIADLNGDGKMDIIIGDKDYGGSYYYYQQACTDADDPQIFATSTTICPGESVTIQVDPGASLGDATSWRLYTSACGGSPVGSGSPNGIFVVSPTVTTTYAVRGEGGCTIANDAICSTVQITVNPSMNTTLTVDENTLTSNETGVSYQWLDCSNGFAQIPNETQASFTASQSGSYAVELDNGTCIDTSVCESVCVVNTNVTVAGTTLSAESSADGYQWIDCADDMPIAGETNQSFSPSQSGNYAVVLTIGNCVDTSLCEQVCILDLSVTATETDLTANMDNAQYLWLDCDDNYNFVGSGSGFAAQTFTPNQSGNYAALISQVSQGFNDCFDTTDCNLICLIDNSVTTDGSSLTANQSSATYQWVDCNNNNQAISGETNQTFVPTAPGNYAVVIDDGVCEKTSECQAFVSLSESEMLDIVELFPNPTDGGFHIDLGSQYEAVQITIYNSLGQSVRADEYHNVDLIYVEKLDEKGVYFVEIRAEVSTLVYKLIQQ